MIKKTIRVPVVGVERKSKKRKIYRDVLLVCYINIYELYISYNIIYNIYKLYMTEKAAICPKLKHLHSLPPLLGLRVKFAHF